MAWSLWGDGGSSQPAAPAQGPQGPQKESYFQPPVEEDDYDPRKPEYVVPATEPEIEAANSALLQTQIAKLEKALVTRRLRFSPDVAEHYEQVLDEMCSSSGRQRFSHKRNRSAPGQMEHTSSTAAGSRFTHSRVRSEPSPFTNNWEDMDDIEEDLCVAANPLPRERWHSPGEYLKASQHRASPVRECGPHPPMHYPSKKPIGFRVRARTDPPPLQVEDINIFSDEEDGGSKGSDSSPRGLRERVAGGHILLAGWGTVTFSELVMTMVRGGQVSLKQTELCHLLRSFDEPLLSHEVDQFLKDIGTDATADGHILYTRLATTLGLDEELEIIARGTLANPVIAAEGNEAAAMLAAEAGAAIRASVVAASKAASCDAGDVNEDGVAATGRAQHCSVDERDTAEGSVDGEAVDSAVDEGSFNDSTPYEDTCDDSDSFDDSGSVADECVYPSASHGQIEDDCNPSQANGEDTFSQTLEAGEDELGDLFLQRPCTSIQSAAVANESSWPGDAFGQEIHRAEAEDDALGDWMRDKASDGSSDLDDIIGPTIVSRLGRARSETVDFNDPGEDNPSDDGAGVVALSPEDSDSAALAVTTALCSRCGVPMPSSQTPACTRCRADEELLNGTRVGKTTPAHEDPNLSLRTVAGILLQVAGWCASDPWHPGRAAGIITGVGAASSGASRW